MDFTTMLHEINKIDKKVLDHAHIHGFRPSIQFEQKQNYSLCTYDTLETHLGEN